MRSAAVLSSITFDNIRSEPIVEVSFPGNHTAMKQLTSTLAIMFVLAGMLLTGWQTACQARDLFQLVGREAAACLHTRQLNRQWEQLSSSEFSARLKQASFFQQLVDSPDFKQLELVKAAIEAASGKPLAQSRRELLSGDMVLAWYHVPGSKPDLAKNCTILLEVENRAAAESALATWNILERQRTESHTHRKITYSHSVKASSNQNAEGFWYTILDNVLAVSAREAHIQRVIDFFDAADEPVNDGASESAGTPHPDCLAVYPPFARAFSRRPDSEIAAIYVNPRIPGSELGRASGDLSALEAVVARCQWLTLNLTQDDSIELNIIADYDSQGTPAVWQEWLKVAGDTQPEVDSLTPGTLFSMSGRMASASIARMILKSLRNQNPLPRDLIRTQRVMQGLMLGLDPVKDILPAIGPAWRFQIETRDPKVSTSFPADALLAFEIRSGDAAVETIDGESEVSPAAALENSLQSGLQALAAVHNAHATGQKVSIVRQQELNGTTIRFADPVAFFRPAFAVTDSHLLLATSPELCSSFLKSAAIGQNDGQSAVARPAVETASTGRSGNLQNVVASTVAAREMLAQHRNWFIRQAQRDRVPEAEAEQRLTQLNDFLQLLDRAWLTASLDSNTIRVSAGIAADKTDDPSVEHNRLNAEQ